MEYRAPSSRQASARPAAPARDSGEIPVERPHVESARLLGGGRELVIDHHGQTYHLRLTRNDKLILTK